MANFVHHKREVLDYQQIIKQLKQKEYAPIYLLHGEESYYIDQVTDFIEQQVLSESEKAFNQTIVYGKDVDAKTLIDTCARYPMMASHQVVILKEAQSMRTLKDLVLYVENPVPTTIFVICHKHKKLPFNTKLGKALKKKATVLEAKRLYDNQVPDWIAQYLKSKKLRIKPEAAALVGEYLGTNLSKISNELEKLVINLQEGTEVTTQHIEQHIGISKDYNVFELQRAIGSRDIIKANRIVNYFTANSRKHPMPVIVGAFYNYFSKVLMLHAVSKSPEAEVLQVLGLRSGYFLREYKHTAQQFPPQKTKQVIHLLKEYDLKSKGVDFNATNAEDGALLKELVWKILHT